MWSVPAVIDNDKFGRARPHPVQEGYAPCPSLAECTLEGWAPVPRLHPETPLVFLTVTDCFEDISGTSLKKKPRPAIPCEAELLLGYATNQTNFVKREKSESLAQRSRRRLGILIASLPVLLTRFLVACANPIISLSLIHI